MVTVSVIWERKTHIDSEYGTYFAQNVSYRISTCDRFGGWQSARGKKQNSGDIAPRWEWTGKHTVLVCFLRMYVYVGCFGEGYWNSGDANISTHTISWLQTYFLISRLIPITNAIYFIFCSPLFFLPLFLSYLLFLEKQIHRFLKFVYEFHLKNMVVIPEQIKMWWKSVKKILYNVRNSTKLSPCPPC